MTKFQNVSATVSTVLHQQYQYKCFMMQSKVRAILQLCTHSIFYVNKIEARRLYKDKDGDEDKGSNRGRERRRSESYSPIYSFRVENYCAFKEACVSRNSLCNQESAKIWA